jgi:hypothetical protein
MRFFLDTSKERRYCESCPMQRAKGERENQMEREEILRGIEAMQSIQMQNPPTSERWIRADSVLRRLVGLLNGVEITPEMWENGNNLPHR